MNRAEMSDAHSAADERLCAWTAQNVQIWAANTLIRL
jgi:hypothetical protein